MLLRSPSRLFAISLLAPVLTIAGCGKSGGPVLAKVEGVVLLDGEPLSNAKVEFNPVEAPGTGTSKVASGGSFAVTDNDGNFTLQFDSRRKGAVLGEHSVRVSTAARQVVPDGQIPKPERVPPQYNLRSKLTFTVEPGSNFADLDLSTTTTARR
jgi:hypothetical protein